MSDPVDLVRAAEAYAAAVERGDILWSIQLLRRVLDLAMDHQGYRLDDADDLGYDWDDIGEVFGMDGDQAASEMHMLDHGPDLPYGYGSLSD